MVRVHPIVFVILRLLSPLADAANFEVLNLCSYSVWAASSPGGGLRLDTGQSWKLYFPDGTTGTRVWGRTNCNFDENGQGSCASGDCDGVLQCNSSGSAPNTVARYALSQSSNGSDFIDISLEDGFNIPMDFSPTSGSCLRGIRCAGNSILDQCPDQLRAPGGCQNPCAVYKTDEYCCTGGGSCGPTDLSRFFKERCPDAYSYPKDDQTSNFTCPQGTDYRVIFCP